MESSKNFEEYEILKDNIKPFVRPPLNGPDCTKFRDMLEIGTKLSFRTIDRANSGTSSRYPLLRSEASEVCLWQSLSLTQIHSCWAKKHLLMSPFKG